MGAPHEHDAAQVLPRTTPRTLLQPHEGLLERIRLAYGATRTQFHADVLPLVDRYAAYVHALPAAFGSTRPEPGGLLRAGLEASLYCLQGAEARIFTGHATITERRDAEPRWRMAAFLAGLCGELHTTACWQVQRDDAATWPRYRVPLASWLQERPGAVHWITPAKRRPQLMLNVVLLSHVVPPPVIEDLGSADGEVLAHLVSAIGGLPQPGHPNPLAELARSALALVAANALQPGDIGDARIWHSEPMARFGVQGLRHLATQRSTWQVNAPRSRVWWGSDGLYLQWPEAAQDLIQWLLDAQVAGVPTQPARWLALLCACGMLVGPPNAAAVTIQPPAPTQELAAVRVAHPHWLLDDQRHGVAPLEAALARTPQLHEGALPPAVPSMPGRVPGTAGESDAVRHAPDPTLQEPPLAAEAVADDQAEGASRPQPMPSAPAWQLRAPLRLPPHVRDVLQAVLLDVQAGRARGAWRLTDGIFICADEWTTRGIAAHSAARALQSCGMAAAEAEGGAALTVRRTPGGEQVGTLIGNAYLDTGAPAAAPSTGQDHADPPL